MSKLSLNNIRQEKTFADQNYLFENRPSSILGMKRTWQSKEF